MNDTDTGSLVELLRAHIKGTGANCTCGHHEHLADLLARSAYPDLDAWHAEHLADVLRREHEPRVQAKALRDFAARVDAHTMNVLADYGSRVHRSIANAELTTIVAMLRSHAHRIEAGR